MELVLPLANFIPLHFFIERDACFRIESCACLNQSDKEPVKITFLELILHSNPLLTSASFHCGI